MFSKAFWKTVADRALVAGAAVFVANLTTGGGLSGVDWKQTALTALGTAVLSALSALLPAGGTGNPVLAYPPNLPVVRKDVAR